MTRIQTIWNFLNGDKVCTYFKKVLTLRECVLDVVSLSVPFCFCFMSWGLIVFSSLKLIELSN